MNTSNQITTLKESTVAAAKQRNPTAHLDPSTKHEADIQIPENTLPTIVSKIGTILRNIEDITDEINVQKQVLGRSAYSIGVLLNEAKAQLGHGEWLDWLKNKVDFSDRSAQRFMRLACEYKDATTVADLGETKALMLLKIPRAERVLFIHRPHNVGDTTKSIYEMNKRELSEVIDAHNGHKTENKSSATPKLISTSDTDHLSINRLKSLAEELSHLIGVITSEPHDDSKFEEVRSALCKLCEKILENLQSSPIAN